MSSAAKPKLKTFRPKTIKIEIGPEEPLPQELATDITAAVPQPFQGEASTGPSMFRKTLKAAKPATAVTGAPKMIVRPTATTRKIRAPIFPSKPATAITTAATVLEPAPIQEDEGRPAPCFREEAFTLEGEGSLLPALKAPEVPLDTEVPPELVALQKTIQESIKEPIQEQEQPTAQVPEDRKGFLRFIATEYKGFSLPRILDPRINPNACSEIKLQTQKQQAFIREYMRQASPYRGVLVQHGLGSGKTCTSIAASEALQGQSNKKIIVMTPIALRENFLNEIMFCGFRHQRLKNVWISFSLKDKATQLFAIQVLGIPEKLIAARLRKPEAQRVIWLPDLDKPDEESNQDILQDWERSSIREQLYETIQNKITFIGQTGFTHQKLRDIAMKQPDFFDNAVIIIDEVHNLTRLMTGKLDKYLIPPKTTGKETDKVKFQRKARSQEPVTVDRWVPKLTSADQRQERAFLFQRLLIQAKNSKIIALSGTPIVNRPTELGILANILHGYFHGVETVIATTQDAKIRQVTEMLQQHPRVNYFSIQKAEGNTRLFFTILDEGYVKVFGEETNEMEGVIYVGLEDARPATIQELQEDVAANLKTIGVSFTGQPDQKAIPLMPPTVDEFNDIFIDSQNLKVKNRLTFAKRMSGLISQQRGSKEELMPKVVKDEIVPCKLSALALPQQNAARLKELNEETKSKKPSSLDAAQALDEKENASYRFRSRAVCNFAFPTDLERPFPNKKSELKAAMGEQETLLGDTPLDLGTDLEAVEEAEKLENAAEAEDADGDLDDLPMFEEEEAVAPGAKPTIKRLIPQKERLAAALKTLDDRKEQLFQMDSDVPPAEQLRTQSSKFAEILKRIEESPGSSLVQSTFKTVEGIGVLGMAMEANGYMPIVLEGSETDLRFSEDTEMSLRDFPEMPRFILQSGDASIRERQTLINLFNCRIDKLPPKMAAVIRESGLESTGNRKGELCRAFMITGAGAEGLSLRNVRTVHIMEPYWNKVRTDQVKGRAVRICSHSDLPQSEDPEKNERTVEVQTQIAVFDPALPIDTTIQVNDDSLTSDQQILGLSEAKERVNGDLLGLLKAGAVDCLLNQSENEKDIQCLVQQGSVNDFLQDPRLTEDISRTEQQVRLESKTAVSTTAAAKPKGREIAVRGIAQVVLTGTDNKKIVQAKDDLLQANPLGEIVLNPATGKEVIAWKKKV